MSGWRLSRGPGPGAMAMSQAGVGLHQGLEVAVAKRQLSAGSQMTLEPDDGTFQSAG